MWTSFMEILQTGKEKQIVIYVYCLSCFRILLWKENSTFHSMQETNFFGHWTVTRSHKIIYFTKVSPKSSPSKPSIFPKKSREKNKPKEKPPLPISFTEEKEKQTEREKKGLKWAEKAIRMKKYLRSCWESRTVTGEEPGLNAEPGYSPGR